MYLQEQNPRGECPCTPPAEPRLAALELPPHLGLGAEAAFVSQVLLDPNVHISSHGSRDLAASHGEEDCLFWLSPGSFSVVFCPCGCVHTFLIPEESVTSMHRKFLSMAFRIAAPERCPRSPSGVSHSSVQPKAIARQFRASNRELLGSPGGADLVARVLKSTELCAAAIRGADAVTGLKPEVFVTPIARRRPH